MDDAKGFFSLCSVINGIMYSPTRTHLMTKWNTTAEKTGLS